MVCGRADTSRPRGGIDHAPILHCISMLFFLQDLGRPEKWNAIKRVGD